MGDHYSCRGYNPLHCIIPPIILERLAKSADKRVRDRALENLQIAAQLRVPGREKVRECPTIAMIHYAHHRLGHVTCLPGLVRIAQQPEGNCRERQASDFRVLAI